MARASKLKVYRMPIGFHDAYVAAPSQKAAAEAWGTNAGVFASGEAELVTDAGLTAEPLASPGVVIKRLRGTAAEQIAALGPDSSTGADKSKAAAKAPSRKTPRPSREAVEAAERDLADAKARQAEERAALAKREAELARERRAMEKAQADERTRLERAIDKAEAAYETALRRWRG